jgi:hypothetical protein
MIFRSAFLEAQARNAILMIANALKKVLIAMPTDSAFPTNVVELLATLQMKAQNAKVQHNAMIACNAFRGEQVHCATPMKTVSSRRASLRK